MYLKFYLFRKEIEFWEDQLLKQKELSEQMKEDYKEKIKDLKVLIFYYFIIKTYCDFVFSYRRIPYYSYKFIQLVLSVTSHL